MNYTCGKARIQETIVFVTVPEIVGKIFQVCPELPAKGDTFKPWHEFIEDLLGGG